MHFEANTVFNAVYSAEFAAVPPVLGFELLEPHEARLMTASAAKTFLDVVMKFIRPPIGLCAE